MTEKLRILDLFSGIGGFSLGLERTGGFETVAFCEISPACRHLLAHHWPGVRCFDDVCTLKGSDVGPVDVICGGFPCQDISFAGKGAGLAGERSGLWREYGRLIGEIRPRFVIVENVSALLVRGFGTVAGDLAALGYDLWWDCIPASAVGAPHRRDRLWIIAYARGEQHQGDGDALRWSIAALLARADATGERQSEARGFRCIESAQRPSGVCEDVAYASREGLPNDSGSGAFTERFGLRAFDSGRRTSRASHNWSSEPDVGGTIDGFPSWLDGLDLKESHALISAYGNAKENGPSEVLRALRDFTVSTDIQRASRGSSGVSSSEVLFAYLCQLEKDNADKARLQLEGEEASQVGLRVLWSPQKPSGPPRRSGQRQQRSGECPDTLQALSRLLARHAEAAWAVYRRENAAALLNWSSEFEEGFDRVTSGVASRVDRLHGLGNAVVPQIPEILGNAILASFHGQNEVAA